MSRRPSDLSPLTSGGAGVCHMLKLARPSDRSQIPALCCSRRLTICNEPEPKHVSLLSMPVQFHVCLRRMWVTTNDEVLFLKIAPSTSVASKGNRLLEVSAVTDAPVR